MKQIKLEAVCQDLSFQIFPQNKAHGHAFIRLHAPWQVLSREAEFLKIKVPTKKVSTAELPLILKTDPSLSGCPYGSSPQVPACVMLCVSDVCKGEREKHKWLMLIVGLMLCCQFLTVKTLSLVQSYELRDEKGLAATMNEVWRKLNQPFQPKVPHQEQEHSRTKFLSHCFSRDKLHLWEPAVVGVTWG